MNIPKDSLVYRSGDIFLPSKLRDRLNQYILGNDRSLYYIDYWSLVHLTTGVLFALARLKYTTGLIVHCAWELWEFVIGMTPITPRGVIDSLNDTLFFSIGWYLATRMLLGVSH